LGGAENRVGAIGWKPAHQRGCSLIGARQAPSGDAIM
jgi:hypothetical protein